MMPGQIALTRTPEWPSSEAIAQVRAWMPALDDEYAAALAAHDLPGDRGDVDDAPALALFDDGPAERAAHVEGAVEVRVDDGPPEVDVEVDHGNPVRAAGRARRCSTMMSARPKVPSTCPTGLVDRRWV